MPPHKLPIPPLPPRYIDIELIDRGGTSVVIKATDEQTGREVAIKLLDSAISQDESSKKLLQTEARLMGLLPRHDHIGLLLHTELTYSPPFLVMEYCPGKTLREIIPAKTGLPVREVLGIACQLADALAHAHKNNIIHNDIKPANILVDTRDSSLGDSTQHTELHVKLTDFGIAAVLDRLRLTSQGEPTSPKKLMGTPSYMSPEHASGQNTEGRSDLYSLGIVMYEMLTGRSPYGKASDTIILHRLRKDPTELELDFPSHIPFSVQNLVRTLVRLDPNSREPNKAEDLVRKLNELTSDDTSTEDSKPTVAINENFLSNEDSESRLETPLKKEGGSSKDQEAPKQPWFSWKLPPIDLPTFPLTWWIKGVPALIALGVIGYVVTIPVPPDTSNTQQLVALEKQLSERATAVREAQNRLQANQYTAECQVLSQQLNDAMRQYETIALDVNRRREERKQATVAVVRPTALDILCLPPQFWLHLKEWKQAVENLEGKKVSSLSVMDDANTRFFENLFDAVEKTTLNLSMTVRTYNPGEQRATIAAEIAEGVRVKPGKSIQLDTPLARRIELEITRDGDRWGKIHIR